MWDLFSGVFGICICFLMPVGSAAYLMLRRAKTAYPVFLGVIYAFLQMLLRETLQKGVIEKASFFRLMTETEPMATALFLALSTVAFEEPCRYLFLRVLMRRGRRFDDGAAFGLGYGGAAAILSSGIVIAVSLLLLGAAPNAEETLLETFLQFSNMIAQVAWSLLMLHGVLAGKKALVFFVPFSRLLMEAGGGLMRQTRISAWIVQIAALLFSTGLLFFAMSFRKDWRSQ